MSKIVLSKNIHGTADAGVYDLPSIKLVDWFSLVDVWGSQGFDRFGDGGLFFEIPLKMYDIIPELPFVNKYHIEVIQE